jgi:hypothetical protein
MQFGFEHDVDAMRLGRSHTSARKFSISYLLLLAATSWPSSPSHLDVLGALDFATGLFEFSRTSALFAISLRSVNLLFLITRLTVHKISSEHTPRDAQMTRNEM